MTRTLFPGSGQLNVLLNVALSGHTLLLRRWQARLQVGIS